ncbi:MAG: hemerythrin domain-containing protein [Chromatiales bacterium]|nr:hemerythrin domain-containing protein [Chromatiales bacterium]
MKRVAALRQLSDDHHQGLVLALRAKKAADGKDGLSVDAIWAEVVQRFADELEPHFQIEERYLAPALLDVGEIQLVQRLHQEHAALRELLEATDHSAASLREFGQMLAQHIRFEERDLFEAAQRLLSSRTLDAIATADSKS